MHASCVLLFGVFGFCFFQEKENSGLGEEQRNTDGAAITHRRSRRKPVWGTQCKGLLDASAEKSKDCSTSYDRQDPDLHPPFFLLHS